MGSLAPDCENSPEMSTEKPDTSCQAIHDLIPAFSLGATDPAERDLVESHLADCPEAANLRAGYDSLAEALLHSAPPVQAPSGLADRLRIATQPATVAAESGSPSAKPSTDRGFVRRLMNALSLHPRRSMAVVAALSLVILVIANLFWSTQLRSSRESQRQLAQFLDHQTELLALIGEDAFLRIELPPASTDVAAGAHATVLCNPDREVGFILAEGLPPLPPEQVYQVWLVSGDQRVSGGLMQPDALGRGWLAFRAPVPLKEFDAVGITPEPAGGSPGPTSPPVIRGPLYGEGYEES